MKIHNRLRELKRRRGASSDDIANHLNVTRRTVQSWLKGTSEPKAGQVLKLANYFKVPTDQLYPSRTSKSNVAQELACLVEDVPERDARMLVTFVEAWVAKVGCGNAGLMNLHTTLKGQ